MPRGAICKRVVRRLSVELVEQAIVEAIAAHEAQGGRKGMTFDESAMRVLYEIGDQAARAALQCEHAMQQLQQQRA